MIVGSQALIAVTHAAVRTLSETGVVVVVVVDVDVVVVVVVVEGDGVGAIVVVVEGVVVTGVDVAIVSTKVRRPTRTSVGMFFARHKPVTGQRKTPDVLSAQSSLIPRNMSVVFDVQPRDEATDTMRVSFFGLSDVLFQHKRGAAFFADHFSTVPVHVEFAPSRVTVPFVVMHTRIVGMGDGVA